MRREERLQLLRSMDNNTLLCTVGRVFNGFETRFTMDDLEHEISRRVRERGRDKIEEE